MSKTIKVGEQFWIVQFRFRHSQPWTTYMDHAKICLNKDDAIKKFNNSPANLREGAYSSLAARNLARCTPIYTEVE